MAINIATKAILKILSFGGIDVEVSKLTCGSEKTGSDENFL